MIFITSDNRKTEHIFSIHLCLCRRLVTLPCSASDFSHFQTCHQEVNRHILTLCSFRSSSLLTPAVSCWFTVAMFGKWTYYWWYFIRVEQIALFSSPTDCSLRQSDTQNGTPQYNNTICSGCASWTTVMCDSFTFACFSVYWGLKTDILN